MNRNQRQRQVADAVEDTVESGLIQRSTDAGFTFSMLDDGQSLEPAQPALIQMAFDAYLIRGGGALGVRQGGQTAGGVITY